MTDRPSSTVTASPGKRLCNDNNNRRRTALRLHNKYADHVPHHHLLIVILVYYSCSSNLPRSRMSSSRVAANTASAATVSPSEPEQRASAGEFFVEPEWQRAPGRWTCREETLLREMKEIMGDNLRRHPPFPEVVGSRRMLRFLRWGQHPPSWPCVTRSVQQYHGDFTGQAMCSVVNSMWSFASRSLRCASSSYECVSCP